MALAHKRVDDIFINTAYPTEGLIALNLYVRGKKQVVTIDDFIPLKSGALVFNKRSTSDGDYWAVLLEKAYAKLNGNYENIVAGW